MMTIYLWLVQYPHLEQKWFDECDELEKDLRITDNKDEHIKRLYDLKLSFAPEYKWPEDNQC